MATFAWETAYGMRHVGNGSVYVVCNAVRDNMLAAQAAANSHTARQVRAVGEVFARGVAPAERLRMNQSLGHIAQAATLARYDRAVTAQRSKANRFPYRRHAQGRNRRYAGGALRRTMASPRFVAATPDEVAFINESDLNRSARHWARLNAGAGSIAGPTRQPYAVRWSNLVVGTLGVDMGPRPAFGMPKGYWFERGEGIQAASRARRGKDEFYPAGTGPLRGRRAVQKAATKADPTPRPALMAGRGGKRPTRGIRGRHFLEAGTDAMAEAYPLAVEQLYRNLWDAGVAGPISSTAVVVGPRPRPLKKGLMRV